MKLLIDFSNILYGSFFIEIRNQEFDELDRENRKNFIKHLFFTKLLYFKDKFQVKSENIVICCDHKITWRKLIFKYYKSNRKKLKDASDIDFEFLYELVEEFYKELTFFPFIVLKNKFMEGDDWIAIISKYFSKNEIEHTIISSDKDFLQLHSKYCFQFSPILNKFLNVNNLKFHKKLKILVGDVKDGIPNVYSDDDCLFNIEKRQKRLGEKKASRIILENEDLKQFFKKSKLLNNFKRNQKLIDFDFIPGQIKVKALELFKKYKIDSDKMIIIVYFYKRKMEKMKYRIDEFFE